MNNPLYSSLYTAALPLMLILMLSPSSNAQSKDRDNPTRLTSNVISGSINAETYGDNYHYTFGAGPGEVTITLTVESEKGLFNINSISYDLFDRDARRLGGKFVMASSGRSEQSVERITVSRRQPLLLRVIVQNNSGSGNFRLRLSGAVDAGQSPGGVDLSDLIPKDTKADCLPKQGTLIVKMKDGSKKIIDLSEAQEVTIVP